jgi:hypothetical protein
MGVTVLEMICLPVPHSPRLNPSSRNYLSPTVITRMWSLVSLISLSIGTKDNRNLVSRFESQGGKGPQKGLLNPEGPLSRLLHKAASLSDAKFSTHREEEECNVFSHTCKITKVFLQSPIQKNIYWVPAMCLAYSTERTDVPPRQELRPCLQGFLKPPFLPEG